MDNSSQIRHSRIGLDIFFVWKTTEMVRTVLVDCWLLMATTLVAPPTARYVQLQAVENATTDPQQAIDRATRHLSAANSLTLKIQVQNTADSAAEFAVRNGSAIAMSSAIAAQARSHLEYLALVALVAGHFAIPLTPIELGGPVDPAKVAAALGVAAAGSQLDKIDPRETDPVLRGRQNLQWQPEPVRALSRDQVAAARSMALLMKAGGCSAPLVTVLRRIVDRGNADVGEPARQFAKRVINGLGATIYPPDRSCLAR